MSDKQTNKQTNNQLLKYSVFTVWGWACGCVCVCVCVCFKSVVNEYMSWNGMFLVSTIYQGWQKWNRRRLRSKKMRDQSFKRVWMTKHDNATKRPWFKRLLNNRYHGLTLIIIADHESLYVLLFVKKWVFVVQGVQKKISPSLFEASYFQISKWQCEVDYSWVTTYLDRGDLENYFSIKLFF